MNIDSWAGEFFLTYLYVILNLVTILIDHVKFELSPSSGCLRDFTYHGFTALHAIMRLGSGLLEVREIVTEDSIKIPCSYDCCYKVRSSLHTGVHESNVPPKVVQLVCTSPITASAPIKINLKPIAQLWIHRGMTQPFPRM